MPTAYPDSPYGISILMDFFSGAPQYEIPMSIVNQAKALPVAWVRLIFSWGRIEGPIGVYKAASLTALDTNIQRFNSVGINVVFCCTSPPTFRKLQSWGGGYYYATASDMNTYATYMANRYKTGSANGVISAIEIGNEDYNVSNDVYHRGWWEAQALNACYSNIKAIDPNMLVLMGGQLQTGIVYVPQFQQELYDGNRGLGIAGVGPNMDATNSHYYRGNPRDPNDPSYPGTFTAAAKIAAMHAVDVTNGYGNRDFWMSEFGWAANATGGTKKYVTYAQQAQYDIEVVEDARAGGASHAFIYTMDYADANSIVASSSKVLPAYTAYQAYIAANPPSNWPGFGKSGGGGTGYKATILSDNPQAYYRLDEQVGTSAADSSSRNYTATYSSTGVTYNQPGLITNSTDTAVLLDGQTGQITCGNGPYTKGWTAITLECWFELSNITFAGDVPLWANDTLLGNGGVHLSVGAGGANLYFSVGKGAVSNDVVATYSFLASTRYYVAATWDGTTLSVWINPSTSTATATYGFVGASLGVPPQSLCIGASLADSTNFPGVIDEAAIYKNVALSGTRILAHYDAGTSGGVPVPVFTLTPTALTPQSPGVVKSGTTYSATVSLGETSNSSGNATWTAASSLSGVTFTPSSGTLTPGGPPALITISGIPALNGTFTFSGGESETPVATTWNYVSTSAAGGFALFANGAGVASFDHYRVTGYPDPAVSLVNIGRVGATAANYNANLPNTNTSVAMNTSLDGVTWTPVATPGDPISGITVQPTPTADTFSVDSSADYTQTSQGTPTVWTWDTANSRIVAVGGTNGFLLSDALTGIGDVDLFVDMDQADSGGIVFCYTDAQDTYDLTIHDASASSNPNTLILTKTVAGSNTALVTYGTDVATTSLPTAGKLATATGGTGSTTTTAIGTALGYGELCALGTASAWPALSAIPAPTGKGWLLDKTTLNNQAFPSGNWTPAFKSKISAGTLTADVYIRAFAYDTVAHTYTFIGICELDAQSWTTTAATYTFAATVLANYSFNGTQELYIDCWPNVTANTSGAGSTFTVNLASGGAAGIVGDMQMTTPGYVAAAGTVTTLASASISFVRGTLRRVRVTMVGGVITAYLDGVQVLTYTDGSPLAAGQIGLRNNGNTSHFYQLYVQPQGQLFSGMDNYIYSQLVLTSSDPLNTPQVLDSATLATGPSIGAGALIPSATYQRTFVSANIDDLNRQSNYWWTIASSTQMAGIALKQLIFQAINAVPAPFVAAQANQQVVLAGQTLGDLLVEGLQVKYSGTSYCNRLILQNVQATQGFVQSFVGDDKATSWTLTYPITVGTVPAITVNGNAVSVGIQGQLTPAQYYYTPGGTGISADSSQSVLTGLQTLAVSYTGSFTTDVQTDNAVTGDYPGTTAQDAYALLDGTSGIVEVVIDVSQSDATRNMTVEQAQNYGADYLQRYGVIGRIVTFNTYRQGMQAGQQLSVFIAQHNMVNAQVLITQVDLTAQADSGGHPLYKYAVTASEGPALAPWEKLFSTLFT